MWLYDEKKWFLLCTVSSEMFFLTWQRNRQYKLRNVGVAHLKQGVLCMLAYKS